MRRRQCAAAVAIAGVVVAATMSAAAALPPPAAAAPSYSPPAVLTGVGRSVVTATTVSQPVTFTVRVGPGETTSCSIVGELVRPVGAAPGRPQPAILTTNGYGGSYTDQLPLADYFAGDQHYVVLAYSGLGFGGSGCNIELDAPAWDGRAASELISWLGNQPEVLRQGPDDPVVGTIGLSYGGAVQFSAASIDPRIDAMVPMITWNDLAYSLAPNNDNPSLQRSNSVPGVLKDEWIAYFFQDGLQGPPTQPVATPFPPSTCPGYAPQVCPDLAASALAGYPTAATTSLLRGSSMITFYRQVRVPTLLMQGEHDTLFTIDEALANAAELRSTGSPVTLVLQSWGHSNDLVAAPGELSYTPGTRAYETVLIDDWFDRYLRHENVSTGPAVQFFRPWVSYSGPTAAPAYGTAAGLPLGHLVPFYLSGNGLLTPDRGAVTPGAQTFANPPAGAPTSYSETSVFQFLAPFSDIPPSDAPGTFASWQTAPLPATQDSLGETTLRFTLSAPAAIGAGTNPAADPVLFTKLYDVAPDGTLQLADRLVAPVRLAAPGQPVTVTLPIEMQHFPAGTSIRLVVAATDSAYLGNRVAQPYTITTTLADPPVLELPLATAAQESGGGTAANGEPGGAPLPAPPVLAGAVGTTTGPPAAPAAPAPPPATPAASAPAGALAVTGYGAGPEAAGLLLLAVAGTVTALLRRRARR